MVAPIVLHVVWVSIRVAWVPTSVTHVWLVRLTVHSLPPSVPHVPLGSSVTPLASLYAITALLDSINLSQAAVYVWTAQWPHLIPHQHRLPVSYATLVHTLHTMAQYSVPHAGLAQHSQLMGIVHVPIVLRATSH
jgi:hypothetical protein